MTEATVRVCVLLPQGRVFVAFRGLGPSACFAWLQKTANNRRGRSTGRVWLEAEYEPARRHKLRGRRRRA